jgi:O-antigen ligase
MSFRLSITYQRIRRNYEAALNGSQRDMTSQPTDMFPRSSLRSNSLRASALPVASSGLLENVTTVLLSIFIFALPTELHFYGDYSVTLPAGFLCIALGALGVIKRRTVVSFSLGTWCFLAFVIWSTLTLAWASYPSLAMMKLVKYWEFLPIALVITQYAWNPRVRVRLFDAFLAGCWFGVLGVFFNFARGVEAVALDGALIEGRYSFGTDPNYLALALVIGICVACNRAASDAPRWKHLFFLCYPPAALMAMVLTGSRGALLALVGAGVVFGICTTARIRFALLIIAATCLVIALVLPSGPASRLTTIPDELNHGTLSGRTTLWETGEALVAERPLQGRGVGAAKGVFSVVVHNTPLELLIEGGLVSLLLFYGAFAYGIYRVWMFANRERTFYLVIFTAWLIGTFSLSWDVDIITWFIVAMLFAAGSAREPGRVRQRVGKALIAVANPLWSRPGLRS